MPTVTYQTGVPILVGDWVRVLSPTRGVWHHGIVRRLVPQWDGGVAVLIANNVKRGGVSLSDWHVFRDGHEIILHRRAPADQVPQILRRVDASMGKTYNLLSQNCEHLASYAFTGKAESKAMQGAGVLTAVLVLLIIGLSGN
jgi:Lecithin retinol acyltransferase